MQGVPEVVLRSEQTNAEIGMIRHVVPVGFPGPPLHRHDFDETFYVLEGQLTVQLGDELFRVETGELAFAPRGVAHTFTNLAEEPAGYLIVFTPAGFERHFARIGRARGRRPARLGARADPRRDRARRPDRPGSRGGGTSDRRLSRPGRVARQCYC